MLQRQRNKGARKRRERGRDRHATQKPSTQGQMHPRLRLMMQLDWMMLTSNLWTGVGLVNGAMGTVIAICYKSGQAPPNLPVPVMLRFDPYPGPTLPDGTCMVCTKCPVFTIATATKPCKEPASARKTT